MRIGAHRLSMDVVGNGNAVVLFLRGDLDERSAPPLARTLEELDAQRPESLWIQLAGIDHVDPIGLQVLLDARTRAEHHGYEVLLRSPPSTVAVLLERVES
jgi:anti-anti-sigma factor